MNPQKAKIKVIKKSEKVDETKGYGLAERESVPSSKEVFRNMSDLVREIQTRKRHEERMAVEAFFGGRLGSTGI